MEKEARIPFSSLKNAWQAIPIPKQQRKQISSLPIARHFNRPEAVSSFLWLFFQLLLQVLECVVLTPLPSMWSALSDASCWPG